MSLRDSGNVGVPTREQLLKLAQGLQPLLEVMEQLRKTLARILPAALDALRMLRNLSKHGGRSRARQQCLARLLFIYHYLLNLSRLPFGKSYALGQVPSAHPLWIAPKAVQIRRALIPRGPSALPLGIEGLEAAA